MWSHVDFWLAVIAGFASGYVMLLGSYWLEAVFGVMRLDFGHTGLQYIGGEKPGWWIVGVAFHLIDSVLLGLAYAAVVWPRLDAWGIPDDEAWSGAAAGITFGVIIWAVLAMLIAMPMMGQGIFGYRIRSIRPAVLSLGLHLIWGTLLGLIYLPK